MHSFVTSCVAARLFGRSCHLVSPPGLRRSLGYLLRSLTLRVSHTAMGYHSLCSSAGLLLARYMSEPSVTSLHHSKIKHCLCFASSSARSGGDSNLGRINTGPMNVLRCEVTDCRLQRAQVLVHMLTVTLVEPFRASLVDFIASLHPSSLLTVLYTLHT